ncbi:Rib/alpha-like domain-containing protein [Lactobacillus sp. 23-2]|uniref:Rib/alpha-like domain-containing protein n=1 Tax=Lactobacillus sp. 23-2 TaxID=2981842 RepID=UPI0038380224
MGKKLKTISEVSVALALFGAAVPAVEAAPTAMAAKKSTKKSVKKSTKKAKKAKKSTKKKSTKKVAKKTSKKKATKKPVKKVAKKKVVKKTAKKAAPKKTTSKKTAKKVVKKATTKKPVKKVAKKTTTKKPVQKVVRRLTMADKYQPKVKSGTFKVNWGTDLTDSYSGCTPENFITNKSSLPSGVKYKYLDTVNTKKGGSYTTRIQATYSDGSKEVVGAVTFVVPVMDSDKYTPTVHDVTLNYGDTFDSRQNAITNAPGYFPNDPALSQYVYSSNQTSFHEIIDPGLNPKHPGVDIDLDTEKPGTYTARIEVIYPDGSYEYTKKFKITVLPSQASQAKISLKASSFTVSSKEPLEQDTEYGFWGRTVINPSRFLNIGTALPKGTNIYFNSDLDSVDAPKPGKYKTSLSVYFPDESGYETGSFIVNVK